MRTQDDDQVEDDDDDQVEDEDLPLGSNPLESAPKLAEPPTPYLGSVTKVFLPKHRRACVSLRWNPIKIYQVASGHENKEGRRVPDLGHTPEERQAEPQLLLRLSNAASDCPTDHFRRPW